ncbi:Abi family protein [Allobranchiibius sp. GilTou38]|nr:Abi family protein [Allobranchiibius sp. GilTou38]
MLVERMVERGLLVPDAARATRYVRHLGYYRLSPYLIPLRNPHLETFRAGTTFDQMLDLYVFDRHLRLLVLDALERVEVAVRSALTDHMSLQRGGPFWYADPTLFRDRQRHSQFIDLVQKTCRTQLDSAPEVADGAYVHRSALEHYLVTYADPLPPSWLMVETLTMGQLDRLVQNLAVRADRSAVAKPLGITEPLLLSWMRSFVRVRNICAHHGRLWNAALGVYPALPQSSNVAWLDDASALTNDTYRSKRLYPVLVALQSILATVSPRSTWAQRLSDILDKHPDVPLSAMGVPETWRQDSFWSMRLDARTEPLNASGA